MGLRDVLFGRKRLKEAKQDALFALFPSAAVSMEVELGLRPGGVAAVVFQPLSAGEFVRAENEMQELLDVAARESSSPSRTALGRLLYGYEWLIIRTSSSRTSSRPCTSLPASWPSAASGLNCSRP